MLWVYGHLIFFNFSVRGSTFKSESDVYRRQNLTTKRDPRTNENFHETGFPIGQFSLICKPHQIMFIHYKSLIATAIHGL